MAKGNITVFLEFILSKFRYHEYIIHDKCPFVDCFVHSFMEK